MPLYTIVFNSDNSEVCFTEHIVFEAETPENVIQQFVDFSISNPSSDLSSKIQVLLIMSREIDFEGRVDLTSEAHLEYLKLRNEVSQDFRRSELGQVCFGDPLMTTFITRNRDRFVDILVYEYHNQFPIKTPFKISLTNIVNNFPLTKRARY